VVTAIAMPHLYSHAPPQASFDLSDVQMAHPLSEGHLIPFARPNPDFTQDALLEGFLDQSDTRPVKTEAERIGADRFGESWPTIRAQRLHAGDSHVMDALMRRTYAHSRIGQLYTPVETPQEPASLWRNDDSGRVHRRHGH